MSINSIFVIGEISSGEISSGFANKIKNCPDFFAAISRLQKRRIFQILLRSIDWNNQPINQKNVTKKQSGDFHFHFVSRISIFFLQIFN